MNLAQCRGHLTNDAAIACMNEVHDVTRKEKQNTTQSCKEKDPLQHFTLFKRVKENKMLRVGHRKTEAGKRKWGKPGCTRRKWKKKTRSSSGGNSHTAEGKPAAPQKAENTGCKTSD